MSPRNASQGPKFIRYRDLEDVAQEIREIYRLLQPKSHRIMHTVPIADDLTEGEIVLSAAGGVNRIYVKLDGVLRWTALT